MRINFFAALLGIVLVVPLSALAQSLGGSAAGEGTPFTVSVRPQYPTPQSQASISFISTSLDLANALLTVSVAGKEIYRGAVQPVGITLGNAGSVANVKVTISSGGVTHSQTIFIQPQDVILVAEPISSAPPLYPGKPLVPIGGSVRVVAMANLRDARGKTIGPANLSYAWTVDNTQIANSSGIGKAAILVASPLQYRARSVSVAVTSQNGSLVGGASLSLMAQEPTVRLYRNDPLLGIRFDRALSGEYAINTAEASLYAAPFSLSTAGGAPLLQWSLNGSPAQTGNSITLRPGGQGQGSSSLSLVASAGNSTATADLSLLFGKEPSFNVFGL